MAEAIATRRIPGKPTGIQTIAKTRGVVSRWTEPVAWSDGTTDDFTEDAVQRYDVELWRAGAKVDDARVKGNRKFWPMTKAEALLTGYSTKVAAVGVDGDAVTADPPAGSATPEDVTLGNIDGTITKPQMGTLGISRFGSTASMNAASAVDSDIWINTSFSPTRVYRRVSGAWVYEIKGDVLQAGTVIADGIVAGAIDGETITGVTITAALFRTDVTGADRIQMGEASFRERIRWYNELNTLFGEIYGVDSTKALVLVSSLGPIQLTTASGSTINFVTGQVQTEAGTPISIGGYQAASSLLNYLELVGSGGLVGIPAANRCRIFYDASSAPNRLRARNADSTQTLASF
jgi:hypothetical protein